eukprot:3158460-Prymnesium_polylepis.1
MRPARAPGRAAGSSRQQGRALGVRVLTVVAARRCRLPMGMKRAGARRLPDTQDGTVPHRDRPAHVP